MTISIKSGVAALTAAALLPIALPPAATRAAGTATRTVAVKIAGGHETNPVDHGRPVVLVAAGLGVPVKVFREAFSHVTPARAGEEPDPAQVQRNKAALLDVLGPYGVTNDELDRVSNHYRYQPQKGELWPTTAAVARATIRGGKVVSVRIVAGGAGYSSTPTVTVPGFPGVRIRATVAYGKDLHRNGRISAMKLG